MPEDTPRNFGSIDDIINHFGTVAAADTEADSKQMAASANALSTHIGLAITGMRMDRAIRTMASAASAVIAQEVINHHRDPRSPDGGRDVIKNTITQCIKSMTDHMEVCRDRALKNLGS